MIAFRRSIGWLLFALPFLMAMLPGYGALLDVRSALHLFIFVCALVTWAFLAVMLTR